jgi:hypothetical protein
VVIQNARRLRRSIATALVISTAGAPGGIACAPQRAAVTHAEHPETAYMDSAADRMNKINDAFASMLTLMEEYAGCTVLRHRGAERSFRCRCRQLAAGQTQEG